jgi:hypothetical protein
MSVFFHSHFSPSHPKNNNRACPISLNHRNCGHTFCALCILRWFFSRIHKPCGGWHESVDCPICRSLLVITPDRPPRSTVTFPFTPNRTVDKLLQDLIAKLARPPLPDKNIVKSEFDPTSTLITPLDAWREGGNIKADWLRRDRQASILLFFHLVFL